MTAHVESKAKSEGMFCYESLTSDDFFGGKTVQLYSIYSHLCFTHLTHYKIVENLE
jgi:hypothetical protein